MFGFGKKRKKEEELTNEASATDKKKKSRTDKLVMGAIIGVAVGSVVGISLQGKNEHEQEEQKPQIQEPKKNQSSSKPEGHAPSEAEPRSHIGRFFKRLFRKKKSRETVKKGQTFKKIPNEWE